MDISDLVAIAPKEARFSTTLGAAIQILRKHLAVFATMGALVWVPSNLLLQAQQYVMRTHAGHLSFGSFLSMMLVLFSSSFAWWIEHAAVSAAVMQHARGETPTLQGALVIVGRRLGELVSAFGHTMMTIFVYSLALVVPGVVQALRCQLVAQVVLFEGAAGKAAIARSAQLTHGRKGRLWLYLFAMCLVSVAASKLLAALGFAPGSIVGGLLVGASTIVTGPLVQIATTLEYASARVAEPAAPAASPAP